MKNKFKLIIPVAGLISALALPGSALASDGTITFSGNLVASTCVVVLNGGGSATGTVTLPNVNTHALATAGNVAGLTNFTLDLSGCGAHAAINVFFEAGANVNPSTGNLLNTGTATNVDVQLFPANNLATQIKPGLTAQAQAPNVVTDGTTTTTGTFSYAAQYHAIATATPNAGTVITTVTYTVVYS